MRQLPALQFKNPARMSIGDHYAARYVSGFKEQPEPRLKFFEWFASAHDWMIENAAREADPADVVVGRHGDPRRFGGEIFSSTRLVASKICSKVSPAKGAAVCRMGEARPPTAGHRLKPVPWPFISSPAASPIERMRSPIVAP